jgi:hypothetical protein
VAWLQLLLVAVLQLLRTCLWPLLPLLLQLHVLAVTTGRDDLCSTSTLNHITTPQCISIAGPAKPATPCSVARGLQGRPRSTQG